MGVVALTRARDRLLAADRANAAAGEVCAEIVRAFHLVARFRASSVMTTDAHTMLPSGGVVEGFAPTDCAPFWDNELLDPDFVKFTDLARSVDKIATLYEAVDGDLDRSPRYRKLYGASGVADELRAAFVSGRSCLAVGTFVRSGPDGPFTTEELFDIRQLMPTATAVLRRATGRVRHETENHPPAVIVLDGDGGISAITEGGWRLLDDLRGEIDAALPALPEVVRAAATRARWSRTSTSLTTRVRGRSGQWLRVHVSPLQGEVGPVAVTIEMARSGDLAQILLESYGLTSRELEIVLLMARGLSSKEIGAELAISGHTVRDHVKAIYGKAGVNSRGELVASLFTNHVLDHFHKAVKHIEDAPPPPRLPHPA